MMDLSSALQGDAAPLGYGATAMSVPVTPQPTKRARARAKSKTASPSQQEMETLLVDSSRQDGTGEEGGASVTDADTRIGAHPSEAGIVDGIEGAEVGGMHVQVVAEGGAPVPRAAG